MLDEASDLGKDDKPKRTKSDARLMESFVQKRLDEKLEHVKEPDESMVSEV